MVLVLLFNSFRQSEVAGEKCALHTKLLLLAIAYPQPLKAITHRATLWFHSTDKQCLMTCLNKAAFITKEAFCCQETFCPQKTVESICPPFCISLPVAGSAAWLHRPKNCVVHHHLGIMPCSKQLRELAGQKHIFSNSILETICPSVIKVTNLLKVLWLGYVTELYRKVASCNHSAYSQLVREVNLLLH